MDGPYIQVMCRECGEHITITDYDTDPSYCAICGSDQIEIAHFVGGEPVLYDVQSN